MNDNRLKKELTATCRIPIVFASAISAWNLLNNVPADANNGSKKIAGPSLDNNSLANGVPRFSSVSAFSSSIRARNVSLFLQYLCLEYKYSLNREIVIITLTDISQRTQSH
jgi:hypothetical protein